MDYEDRDHDGVTCICSGCSKTFIVVMDDYDLIESKTKGKTNIEIQACNSGGVYGAYIMCPYCNHKHYLK